MPGGIWQEATHGCWTQLELPMSLSKAFEMQSNSLLHEAILHASNNNMNEVVDLLVRKNENTLFLR